VALTSAPGMTAPLLSVTRPSSALLVPLWAGADGARRAVRDTIVAAKVFLEGIKLENN